MRIFILEDEIHEPGGLDGRHRLKHILRKHELTLATSRCEGEELYRPGTYDLMLLDHDLEGRPECRPDYHNTGWQFVKWLVEYETKPVPTIIHSHNYDGGKKMMDLLTANGWKVERHFYGRAYETALEKQFGKG